MTREHYTWEEIDEIPTRDFRVHPRDPDVLLPLRRSWRRLPHVDYSHPDCLVLATLCTAEKRPIFGDDRTAGLAKSILLEQHRRVGHRLFAYVIMPDHVHFVLSPGNTGITVGRILGRWKTYVTRQLKKQGMFVPIWQRDYDDRVLRCDERSEEGFFNMINYVLNNPVRKGLARDWKEYPYCGFSLDGRPPRSGTPVPPGT